MTFPHCMFSCLLVVILRLTSMSHGLFLRAACMLIFLQQSAAVALAESSVNFLEVEDSTLLQHSLLILHVEDVHDEQVHVLTGNSLATQQVLRLKKNGVVRSSNPVWNVCVSGKPIRKGLVSRNVDSVEYRRGHLHKKIPFSCRDYHRGALNIWEHPDFYDLQLLLDSNGSLLGGLPYGYIAVRDP